MAMQQATRGLKLFTPLGEDELLLTGLRAQEEISGLFHCALSLISDNNAIAAKDIVGKNVTVSVEMPGGSSRYFNGHVIRFVAGDEDDKGRRNYRAEVVPWLWFLTRTSDCRIFQNKEVPKILEQIFGDLGFSDYETSQIKGSHPERDYCVQYRETDFEFVSRLMEEEGIFYYFRHEQGKHTLVLADQKGAYQTCDESQVDFPRDLAAHAVVDHLTAWEHAVEFRTGKWAHTDYNFETPSNRLMTNEQTVLDLPGMDKYEFYDYPGRYGATGDGSPLAKIRMEEEEAGHDVVQGGSTCKSFTPGYKFTIGRHRNADEEGQAYLLTAVEHVAVETMAYETGGGAAESEYSNTFQCIPAAVVYRPPRRTRKPVVQGCQTAVVTGPPGEEIYPDKYGRVKVQFHWDREGQKDDKSSCWIRVSQVHAGKGWGGIDIPRIGEEVIVDFLEGDPDRPIIIGRVYHAESMPPFDLPGSKTISGLKSNTHKGSGYNEYVMDDTAGNELIREHAQFDKDSTIENDLREHVLNDRSRDVAANETVSIGSNQDVHVKSNQSIKVDSDRSIDVGSNQTVKVGANEAIQIGAEQKLDVGAAQKITVGAARTASVSANDELSVGGSQAIGVSGAIEISSDTSITLTVGSSTVEIKPASISLKSPTITIEGDAKVEVKSAMITSQAMGNHEITGAIVKIN